MTTCRPLVRYFGGKARLAPWILSHFPPHVGYVEPFGGGASVLLLKPPVRLEVYNDIDSGLVNLFRVLRDPDATARLIEAVEWTPYSKEEFTEALEPAEDPVESARRFLVRSWQSYAGRNATPTWGRVLDPGRLSEWPRPRMWQGIPEDEYADAARRELVAGLLAHCSEKEAYILRHYYGLEGEEPKTLEQIAAYFGQTCERIRQLKARALLRLQDELKRRSREGGA